MARRCLNTEAQRHRARSCTVPDASRVAGAGKVRLGDVCSFSKGQQINGKELSDSYDYPFINGGVSPSGNWKDYNVEKGAITISEGGNSCGFVNYFEVPFWCGAHCYYFYELKLEPKYFYYALKANEERLMGLRSGICMPNIRKGDLDEFEFCIDWDKATQQRIADELDRLCAMKKNAEDRLAILDQIVKSRFVEMFGDETELSKLADETELITKGTTPTSLGFSFVEEGVNFVKIETFCEDGSLLPNKVAHITEECHHALRRSQLKVNDVLFSIAGAIGRVAVVDDRILPANTNQALAIIRLRTDARLIVPYLVEVLKSEVVSRQYMAMKQGVAQLNISLKNIGDFRLPVPPLALQREFAAFVAEVDKSKLTLRETVATLDQLYRAKLQEYFG